MEKQVQTKQSNALSTDVNYASWGAKSSGISSKDIIIPKIVPINYMSKKFTGKEAEYGEFRDTLTNTLFGSLDKPFLIVPFHIEKVWYEFNVVTNKGGARKKEFSRTVPVTVQNQDLPFADADGKIERDYCIQVYCLIPSEVELGAAMPYVMNFRRTNLKAGKQIATQFLKNDQAGKKPSAVAMEISGSSMKNEEGEWVVVQALPKRKSTEEEETVAWDWYQLIAAGKAKVDHSDEAAVTEEKVVSKDDDRF